jgi:anti-anti-sigma factor
MTVTTYHTADTVILRCHGRLVRGEESSLLCAAVQQHGNDVVVDFEGVTAIDAAGIGALLSLQAAGIYLRLVSPTEPVREALRLTGLEAVFEIGEAKKGEELLVPRVVAHEHLPDARVAIPR